MLLAFRDVSLRLGSTVLLDHASFGIERGERVCLIGRNGAGKSTLLKVAAGEAQPEEGEIIRSTGLRIARLEQDVPDAGATEVYEVVARGLGELGAVVAEYHHLAVQAEPDLRRMGQLQTRIDAEDGWSIDARIQAVVSRLELPPDAPFSSLSGGMKRRVLLGQALVSDPDLLLLDEPTNHLDIPSIQWLEGFLREFSGAILFITHDRAFLRALATRILELDRGELTSWPGDYEQFLLHREERRHAESQARALFDKKLAQEEVWIRKGIEARRTRDMGRVKRLVEMRRAFAERRNAPGQARMLVQEAERSGKLVAQAENVSFSYAGRALIRGLSTTVLRGDKIGVIGPNGAGKTTLLNLLLGRLSPQSGTLKLGSKLEVAYFDQLRAQLNESATVAENVAAGRDHVEINGARKHIISYLQDFLFTPDRARSPVRALSGGERNRLLLARLFSQPSNLLVLDEPTNDLDVETLELLEELILDYSGTVLLVSHDRAFLNAVATRSLVFEGGGRVRDVAGGYDDWLRESRAAEGATPAPTPGAPAPRPAQAVLAPPGRLSNAEKRELDKLPAQIEALESEQAEWGRRMAEPAFFAQDPGEIARAQQRLRQIETELAGAYQRWEQLEAQRQGV
jgi:ABC transport system ATP-binding/permease protein